MNRCSRHTLWCLVGGVLAAGCGHTQRTLVYEKSARLPSGRFTGPVELELPAQSQRDHRWYEIHTELEARCAPLLAISYPDGEVAAIGDRDHRWQALQRQRAEHREVEAPQPETGDPEPEPSGPGRWRQVRVERWPGQLEFLRRRDERCGRTRTFRRVHYTAVDRDQRLALWAEIPQELDGAEVRIKVYEVVDVDGEREAAERARAAATIEVRPARPRPPRPEPKVERPKPAEARGATWTAGHWEWHGSRGTWVWISGYWRQPATTPALRGEHPGAPPIAGCSWVRGYWAWVPGSGRWEWVGGHWNPPPPKVEDPGAPPVPESPWIAGQWVRAGASFEWRPGHWGKPRPRVETPPPRPSRGARWQPGVWIQIAGEWTWSPGTWISSSRKPPPRRRETPGARPHPNAVWLQGFWRWAAAQRGFTWIPGRWERPPGDGYVWVPDPVDQTAGVSISGKWVLDVDVNVKVKVKR